MNDKVVKQIEIDRALYAARKARVSALYAFICVYGLEKSLDRMIAEIEAAERRGIGELFDPIQSLDMDEWYRPS